MRAVRRQPLVLSPLLLFLLLLLVFLSFLPSVPSIRVVAHLSYYHTTVIFRIFFRGVVTRDTVTPVNVWLSPTRTPPGPSLPISGLQPHL